MSARTPNPPPKPNKYRRAFDWRLSEGQQGKTLENYGGMSRLATSDYPDILEDFLAISRRRKQNPTALARLQIHMLEELLLQEGAIKHYRGVLKDLRDSEKVKDKDVAEVEKETKFYQRELFFHRFYANAIRGVADGLAWRILGYDRAVTRVLGERETKQHLSSEGTMQELREWAYHFETGSGIALLNALTNCLAFGDVTVVRPDSSVEIVEVKTNKTKSGRKCRQKQAMSEVVTLLSEGEGKNEDREVNIEILPITPETNLSKVEELLNLAGESGWAARRITDYLYVEAFDFSVLKDVNALDELTTNVRRNAIGAWEDRGDFIFDLSTLDALEYTPNCAPFSIFPFRARTCIDLLIGQKFYVTFLNHTEVEREFEKRGWEIRRNQKELVEDGNLNASLEIRKGGAYCIIPPADFMRMQIETVRPKTFIDAYEQKLRQGPQSNQGHFLAIFEGEPRIWN